MGLESASYISGFVTSNPAATDFQSQGDDHIRLLKSVLQGTFPNASKSFRFPTDSAIVATNVTVTFPDDQNKIYRVNASAANRTVTLPAPSGVNAPGWGFTVVRTDATAGNTVTVSGGTINGSASYVLRGQYEVVHFIWMDSSSDWLAIVGLQTFAAATKLTFQQTTAPLGWTKDTTHNDKALRVVSGSASSGGTTAFTTVFAARTILQANLPAVDLTSDTVAAHTHGMNDGTFYNNTPTTSSATSTSGPNTLYIDTARQTESGGSHSHTVPLGGSGTAMDFAVQYVDLIIATKD